jgi:hypothetical protein
MKRLYNILFFLLGIAISGIGQTKTIIKPADVYHELWTEATAKLKINKHWRLEYSQAVRFRKESVGYKYTYSELGLQYKFNNAFALKLKGRYVFLPDTLDQFKYYADFTYDFLRKGFPLRMDYRLRIGDAPQTDGYERETYIRNRFGLSYNLSKIADPYIQYELFYSLGGTFPHKLTDHRYYAGINWSIGKHLGINSGYFFDQEIQEKVSLTDKGNTKIIKPDRMHAFILELEYTF